MKPLLLSLLLLFIVQICSAQDSFLTISTGGGFTGMTTIYKITTDGKVLKGKGLGQTTYTEESKLKKSTFKNCFRKAQALLKSSPDFNYPGNIYFAIATFEKDKESKITWGDSEHTAPEEATKLYQEIMTILNELNFSPKSITKK